MKNLMMIGCFAVAGCATSTRVSELEQRLAKVEGDLYRVEVKAAPQVPQAENVVPKFVPAKELEPNVVDAKIKAFVKEYAGVEFGESRSLYITNKATVVSRKMLKNFQYFEDVRISFSYDKLTRVEFYCNISANYSINSCKARIDQTVADMLVTWGLPSDYLDSYDDKVNRGKTEAEKEAIRKRLGAEPHAKLNIDRGGRSLLAGLSSLGRRISNQVSDRYFCIRVCDNELVKLLNEQAEIKNAEEDVRRKSAGAELPVADEAGLKAIHEAATASNKESKAKEERTNGPMAGGPGRSLGSLRERRALREQQRAEAAKAAEEEKKRQEQERAEEKARREEEKAQHEKEREEQRAQLLQIQEELKKAREARAAEEREQKRAKLSQILNGRSD